MYTFPPVNPYLHVVTVRARGNDASTVNLHNRGVPDFESVGLVLVEL
jgi:hypothetical protein